MKKEKTKHANFLLEIGAEELPAHSLQDLVTELAFTIERNLQNVELGYMKTSVYASPRRLAILIHQLA